MSTPITVTIAHQLGREQARRRLEAGFDDISRQLPGSAGLCSRQWHGDRLDFSVAGLGQSISGTVDVQDEAVVLRVELPGVLGLIASGLKGRLGDATQRLLTKQ